MRKALSVQALLDNLMSRWLLGKRGAGVKAGAGARFCQVPAVVVIVTVEGATVIALLFVVTVVVEVVTVLKTVRKIETGIRLVKTLYQ